MSLILEVIRRCGTRLVRFVDGLRDTFGPIMGVGEHLQRVDSRLDRVAPIETRPRLVEG